MPVQENNIKPKIYLDTSVISALFDTRTPERLDHTKTAWERLKDCEVFIDLNRYL
ncbi:hypothetical protein RDn1_274 [Candidatus Termititenax dinenymphae]|uniref:Uncharacterized protein n=1 Tax=Candidatus Termititenax dinenymphae TaxID=2218523 RepID=A0A388TN30_9BACT|nr:hypothetical protein RDn1_274 [Candidatus Termititenax dinenymphae]